LGPVKVSIHSAGVVFVGFGESSDWVGLVKQEEGIFAVNNRYLYIS